MSEEPKDLHLRFPSNVWEAIKNYADESGCSYTNVIYTAVFFFLYSRNLIDIKKPTVEVEDKRIINQIPEDLKFCDGDSCKV